MHRSQSSVYWSPRYPWLIVAAVCAVATLLLAWPALFGGFLVNPHSDQYIAGFPYRQFAAESLRAGLGFPQWNPYLQGGMPYIAAMHGDIFYPTFVLRLLLPTDIAMTWGFVLHLLLAGIFTTGFLRAAGFSLLPALIGGTAYMMSGQLASFPSPGHDGKLFVSALLPLTLWMLLLGVRDGRRWSWGVLALVVGLGVLSPHPQLLQYMLLTAGAFALFAALVPRALRAEGASPTATADAASARPQQARRPLRRLVPAAIAVVIGFAIGAAQFLPVSEYVEWSPRAGGKGYEYSTSFSMPLEETINMWLPQFSGILDAYWGANRIHFHSEYLGVVVLLLACVGVLGGASRNMRAHAWFWLGTFVVALFWAWGGETPFYHLVYAVVPGTKFFRAPSTILYVVSFSAAMLAAFGADRLLSGKTSVRFAIGAAIAGAVTLLLGVSGGFTRIAEGVMVDPSLVTLIDRNAPAVTAGAIRVALIAFAVAVVAWLRVKERLVPVVAGGILLAVSVLDLWSIGRNYWLFSDRADVLYAADDAIAYMQSQPQPGRVLALGFQGGDQTAPRDPFLGGSALMAQDVRDVLGYHGNELGRYRQLIEAAGNAGITGNPNFWALTNAQYLYTNLPELPLEGSTRLVGPTRNAAGSTVYLYRLPGDNPYAWVTPVGVRADDDRVLATVLDQRFDLKSAALVAPESPVAAAPADSVSQLPAPLGARVSVAEYAPGAVTLSIDGEVPAGATLVVSENFYPGWRAAVDGKPAAVGRADFVLTAVELPAGARAVRLWFANEKDALGQGITLFALLLAAGWAGVGFLQERRLARGAANG